MTTEHWLSIVDYARMFNVSDMTVRRRIKAGKLPAKLIDQKYYIAVPSAQPQAPQPQPPQPMQRQQAPQPHAHPHPQHYQNLVKSHPQAQRTYAQPQPAMYPESIAQDGYDACPEDGGVIPGSLKRPLVASEASLVDTRALLAFCEASMRKMAEVERRQIEKFKAKLETLEVSLEAKDQEVKGLKQQLEDLQLLVKFLDERRR
jgi:hypothetical protein